MGVPPPEFKGAATSMGAKLLRVVCVWFVCVCVSVYVHLVCLWCVSVCLCLVPVPCRLAGRCSQSGLRYCTVG